MTSASLCDAILASSRASFLTPFARLGVPPEGCSSVHFSRVMGEQAADKMLAQGYKVGCGWNDKLIGMFKERDWIEVLYVEMSAEEGQEVGLVLEVVEHEELLARAQDLAEDWVGAGRTRALPAGADRSAINTFQ